MITSGDRPWLPLTIQLDEAGLPRAQAAPHVAGIVPNRLVQYLQPHAVGAIPLHLALEGDVLLLPEEDEVLHVSHVILNLSSPQL
jgi:hypothetical protein